MAIGLALIASVAGPTTAWPVDSAQAGVARCLAYSAGLPDPLPRTDEQANREGWLRFIATGGERNDLVVQETRGAGWRLLDRAAPIRIGAAGSRNRVCTRKTARRIVAPPSENVNGFVARLGAGDDAISVTMAQNRLRKRFAISGEGGDDRISLRAGGAYLQGGPVSGGPGDDQIRVAWTAPPPPVYRSRKEWCHSKEYTLRVDGDAGADRIEVTAPTRVNRFLWGALASPTKCGFRSDRRQFMIDGGPGPDVLIGNAGRDDLRGGAGDDRIVARGGGFDLLQGGAGDDVIELDPATDRRSTVDCGPGNDVLRVPEGLAMPRTVKRCENVEQVPVDRRPS